MREIRLYGSEGGEAQSNEPSLPLSITFPLARSDIDHSGVVGCRDLGMDFDQRISEIGTQMGRRSGPLEHSA
jgi:hypothetical protein